MTSTTLPVTPEEESFRKTAESVTQLQSALSNPFVKEALRIIRDESRPRGILPDPVPGLHPDTNLAHYYHFIQGVNCALDRLQRLARAFDPRERDHGQDADEFDYVADEVKPLPIPDFTNK